MAGGRVKGQEASVQLILNGVIQNTVSNIRSFEFTFQTEALKEGYLGMTTDLRDTIYHGIAGSMEMHNDDSGVFRVIAGIIDMARRRTPGTMINLQCRISYPNGQRALVIIPDAQFGEIPYSFGSRSDYGTIKLSFEAAEAQVIA